MRRSLLILLAVVVIGAATGFSAFRLAGHLSSSRLGHPTDDLEWLRLEFGLGEAEMARVRQLHEGYLPQCQHFCDLIADRKRDLQQTLGPGTNLPTELEQRLAEIGAIRAQCQGAMLRHFAEVSALMPPEQGRRYLAEMQRLTLGSHERIEESMSRSPAHDHH